MKYRECDFLLNISLFYRCIISKIIIRWNLIDFNVVTRVSCIVLFEKFYYNKINKDFWNSISRGGESDSKNFDDVISFFLLSLSSPKIHFMRLQNDQCPINS